MQLTPLQKRAERKQRNQTSLDMNLVSLIDIFTILLFFLMSSAAGVEILTPGRAVVLPQSRADTAPRETPVITISATDILVDGRHVAMVKDALAAEGEVIAGLKSELDRHAARQSSGPGTAAGAQTVTILGDREIPYRLLRKVMVTAARANFSDISFAVTRKASKT